MSKFIAFFICIFCASASLHAIEPNRLEPLIEQIILSNEGVCFQVGKHEIVAESLQVSREGVFILVNGEWLVMSEALGIGEHIQASWVCKKCKSFSMEGINTCPYCGTPRG